MAYSLNDPIQQAKEIVRYETHEKGVFGQLAGFEARDGILSKALKSFGVVGTAIATAVGVATTLTGLPVLALGALAVAGGALTGTINRYMMKNVLSDVHDAKSSLLGKFVNYELSGLAGSLIAGAASGIALAVGGPIAATATWLVSAPLAVVGSSKVVANTLGNTEQIQVAQNARAIANEAMSRGSSVEQVIGLQPQKARATAPAYQHSVTPEEYQQLQANMKQSHSADHSFAQKMEQDRAAAAQQQHGVNA